jgi:hypothetical protein
MPRCLRAIELRRMNGESYFLGCAELMEHSYVRIMRARSTLIVGRTLGTPKRGIRLERPYVERDFELFFCDPPLAVRSHVA